MAVTKCPSPETVLRSCFPDAWIRETARAQGAITRQRKVDISVFFWSVVLGFAVGSQRTLSQLHRAFELSAGLTISRSGFYDRFTPQLVAFFKTVVLHALSTMAEPGTKLGGRLAGFRDLVVADSTVIRLRDALRRWYPACRTNHTEAALKLHLVMSVTGMGPKSIQMRGERCHDSRLLRVGPWVRGRLLLMDLGYFGYRLFDRIARNGGYYVSRFKKGANPLIVANNLVHRGRSRTVVGQRLLDVLPKLKRKTLDVIVEVRVKHRAYRGIERTVKKRFRLVAVYNAEARRYHTYITNIPASDLSAGDIASIYAARWQVELLFKQLKTHFRLDELPSEKPAVVESLLYASILTMIVSRRLLQAFQYTRDLPFYRTPPSRWAAIFSFAAPVLLFLMWREGSRRQLLKELTSLMMCESVDPNVSRRLAMRELAC